MLRILTVIFLALLACPAARAIEIKDKRWGFDGKVRPGHFNILSVLVDHPGGQPFDGQLSLDDRRGLEKSVGAPLVQQVYLAAGTRRWVQFHVFVNQPGGEWNLRWGKGGREAIDGAQFGPPARVLLIDPESPFAAPGALRAFPDDLFPTTVAATDALDAVVLDHPPRWELARREAFLDWLYRGGTAHVLHGADGKFPQFPETLGVLNENTRIGAGRVVRHEAARGEVTDAFLATAGFPAVEMTTENNKVRIYNLDTALLQKLAALTKPEIVWSIIYLLTACYVAFVGPLHYRWSKGLPWPRSIALLLAIVAGFGGAFAFAGRRGANETQQIHAIAIAHSLGDGRYDVMQWISAFATKGDFYQLAHAAPANLYSTATEFDSVNGAIFNGRDGHFDVDIPLYSTRPFVHRGVLMGERTEVSGGNKWEMDGSNNLTALELVPVAGFPQKIANVWVRHRDRFYEMKSVGDRWVLSDQASKSTAELFSDNTFHSLNLNSFNRGFGFFGGDDPKRDDAWKTGLGPVLIARALGSIEGLPNIVPRPTPDAQQLQIFIYASLPDGFRVKDKRFGSQTGHVLYVQDIFKP